MLTEVDVVLRTIVEAFFVCVARMGTSCCLVFGRKLFTDCSRAGNGPPATVPDMEHLYNIAFDRKQSSVHMGPPTIEQLTRLDRCVLILGSQRAT